MCSKDRLTGSGAIATGVWVKGLPIDSIVVPFWGFNQFYIKDPTR